ncbi:MAG: beta-glucosidase [Anaerolineales bacterium]|nr:beta-glucosidase [Anaerolineales bacterium]
MTTPAGRVFPAGFVWGVATSAYQIEGAAAADGKGPSIWDTFSHQPGHTRGGATGDIAVDHYHRYAEDVRLMAELGLPTYRFSTAWTRVVPTGSGPANPLGLDFYDRLVDELLAHHIEPYLTLFHYDLPQALQDAGGWPNRDTAYRFADYAHIMAERLGDRVTHWITHNEPLVTAFMGHLSGEHAPGIKDPTAAFQAGHHLLLSHGLAYAAIRGAAKRPPTIGITLNLTPIHPASDSEADAQAAARVDMLSNRLSLDPLLRGAYPPELQGLLELMLAGALHEGDLEIIRRLDWLGVNYYSRAVVRYDPDVAFVEAGPTRPVGHEYSQMWEIYPPGLYELLTRIWRDYAPSAEIVVAENGVPVPDGLDFDGRVRDERRIRYLRDHLAEVQRAVQAGVPVRGYFVWSLLDNFEWALGYGMRFGLIYVDYETLARTLKDSGRWYSRVIAANALPD